MKIDRCSLEILFHCHHVSGSKRGTGIIPKHAQQPAAILSARRPTHTRGAIRAACQRSTSKSLTAATASIQMDLAFVGGEGEQTKDLNPVLLAPLPDATTGRISSERKRDYSHFTRF